MIILPSNDEFLEVIKNGWEGSIEIPIEKDNKNQENINVNNIRSLVVGLGDITGAIIAYKKSGGDFPERVYVNFRVLDEGIYIFKKSIKNQQKKEK